MYSSNEVSLRWYIPWLLDFRGERTQTRRVSCILDPFPIQYTRLHDNWSWKLGTIIENNGSRKESIWGMNRWDCCPIFPRLLPPQTRDWICWLVRSFWKVRLDFSIIINQYWKLKGHFSSISLHFVRGFSRFVAGAFLCYLHAEERYEMTSCESLLCVL